MSKRGRPVTKGMLIMCVHCLQKFDKRPFTDHINEYPDGECRTKQKEYKAHWSKTGQTITFNAINDNEAWQYLWDNFIDNPNQLTQDGRDCITL